jgi:DNA-directed RNA polymerase specialized sigma24 family protein
MHPSSSETEDPQDLSRQRGLPTSLSLLARLRRRDGQEWQMFVSLYVPLVVRWCQRRGLAEVDIADVTQEVFRKVVRSLDLFRKETATDSFRGCLCRITPREIAQFFRRRGLADVPARGGGWQYGHCGR